MKVLVVFDSIFGNTEKVAHTIGESLKVFGEVQVAHVREVQPAQVKGINLLVVGSPTRQFRATEAIMNFLSALPDQSLQGIKATAFDTRIELKDIPFIFRGIIKRGGYADKPISEALLKKGAEIAAPSMGFNVFGQEGPLKEGELERAASWARSLIIMS